MKGIPVEAGCGPRHLDFYSSPPDRVDVYIVCEISNMIMVMSMTAGNADSFKLLQTISTLPLGTNSSTFTAAEIAVTPDGSFVYSSNRNNQKDIQSEKGNTIAAFRRQQSTGKLELPSFFPSGGKAPGFFGFSPDKAASLVVVTNVDSNLLTMHERDRTTGALAQIAQVTLKTPTMALFRY